MKPSRTLVVVTSKSLIICPPLGLLGTTNKKLGNFKAEWVAYSSVGNFALAPLIVLSCASLSFNTGHPPQLVRFNELCSRLGMEIFALVSHLVYFS